MSPAEAARLLDLPAGALPEQIDARFHELCHKLEEKIARAPTPGLQTRYRAALADIEKAASVLIAAADSGHLPALQRSAVNPLSTVASAPAPATPVPAPASASHGVAAAIVFVILLALAGGGAWYWRARSAATGERPQPESAPQARTKESADAVTAPAAAAETAETGNWPDLTVAELLAMVQEARAKTAATSTRYDMKAAELETAYRTSSHKPALWRAETWVEAHDLRLAAAHLRESLAADKYPWIVLRQQEEALAGSTQTAALTREQLEDAVFEAVSEVDRGWIALYRKTPLAITSEPAGLTWTIQSTYDQGKILVVTGTTPVNEERFVGHGKGILRITHPGSPDFEMEVDLAVSPWNGVDADAKFTR